MLISVFSSLSNGSYSKDGDDSNNCEDEGGVAGGNGISGLGVFGNFLCGVAEGAVSLLLNYVGTVSSCLENGSLVGADCLIVNGCACSLVDEVSNFTACDLVSGNNCATNCFAYGTVVESGNLTACNGIVVLAVFCGNALSALASVVPSDKGCKSGLVGVDSTCIDAVFKGVYSGVEVTNDTCNVSLNGVVTGARRRASPLEGHRPHFTSRVMTSILPSAKSSAVSSVAGIFSRLPLPENRPRAVSCALPASSSPWTSLVSS